MLKTALTHPEILRILARAGDYAKIIIADGHYPASTKRGPNAELVSLNLTPGVVTCSQARRALLSAVSIDAINTTGIPEDDPYASCGEPRAWKEHRAILDQTGNNALKLEQISKWDSYDAVESKEHVLTIQTAEPPQWANVLLTIGVRTSKCFLNHRWTQIGTDAEGATSARFHRCEPVSICG